MPGHRLYEPCGAEFIYGNPTSASNLWGYVDLDDNREYAIIGLRNGTGVVDVTDPANPRHCGAHHWRKFTVA